MSIVTCADALQTFTAPVNVRAPPLREAWAQMRNDLPRILRRIGRRIGELRAERGRTQEQLAVELDVSANYLRQVEVGAKGVSLRVLCEFADALEVDVSELLLPARGTTTRSRGPRARPRR
jgi:ribosome-binding protein aMBF1 (putative translation factor)